MNIFYFFFYGFKHEIIIYDFLYIKTLKKYIPTGEYTINLIKKKFSVNFRIISNINDARIWIIFTAMVEILHFTAFIVFMYVILSQKNSCLYYIMKILINTFINIFPIFIQRYNRIRLIEIFNVKIKDLY